MYVHAAAVFLMVITFNLLVLCQHQQIVECTAAADCPRNGSIQPFYAQVRPDVGCSSANAACTTRSVSTHIGLCAVCFVCSCGRYFA